MQLGTDSQIFAQELIDRTTELANLVKPKLDPATATLETKRSSPPTPPVMDETLKAQIELKKTEIEELLLQTTGFAAWIQKNWLSSPIQQPMEVKDEITGEVKTVRAPQAQVALFSKMAMSFLPNFTVNQTNNREQSKHFGDSPIAVATFYGSSMRWLVKKLIAMHADVDLTGKPNHPTPLGYAVENGDWETAEMLLKESKEPYKPALNRGSETMQAYVNCPVHLIFASKNGKKNPEEIISFLTKLFEKSKPDKNLLSFMLLGAVNAQMLTVCDFLIKQGAEVNLNISYASEFDSSLFPSVKTRNILFHAVVLGDPMIVAAILQVCRTQTSPVNLVNFYNDIVSPARTALSYALENNNLPVVKLLVQAGAKITKEMIFAALKNLQLLQALLEGCSAFDQDVFTEALHKILKEGRQEPEMVAFLVKKGANVNTGIICSPVEENPYAIYYPKPMREPMRLPDITVLAYVLTDERFQKQRYAMVEALFAGPVIPNLNQLHYLPLSRDIVDIDASNTRMPLEYILLSVEFDARYVELFVRFGASINAQVVTEMRKVHPTGAMTVWGGKTSILHKAVRLHTKESKEKGKLAALINTKANGEEKSPQTNKFIYIDEQDNTPLMVAMGNPDTEAASVLLAAGADPNYTPTQKSPLQLASESDREDLIKLLVMHGATVSVTSMHALMAKVTEDKFLEYLKFFLNPSVEQKGEAGLLESKSSFISKSKPAFDRKLFNDILIKALQCYWHTVIKFILSCCRDGELDFNQDQGNRFSDKVKTLLGFFAQQATHQNILLALEKNKGPASFSPSAWKELLICCNRYPAHLFKQILNFVNDKNILKDIKLISENQIIESQTRENQTEITNRMRVLERREADERTAINDLQLQQKVNQPSSESKEVKQNSVSEIDKAMARFNNTTDEGIFNRLVAYKNKPDLSTLSKLELAKILFYFFKAADTLAQTDVVVNTRLFWVSLGTIPAWDVLLLPIPSSFSGEKEEKSIFYHLLRGKNKDRVEGMLRIFLRDFPLPKELLQRIERAKGMLSTEKFTPEVERILKEQLEQKTGNSLLAFYFTCFNPLGDSKIEAQDSDRRAVAKIVFFKICALLSGEDNGQRLSGEDRWQVNVLQMIDNFSECKELQGTQYVAILKDLKVQLSSPEFAAKLYPALLDYLGKRTVKHAELMSGIKLVMDKGEKIHAPVAAQEWFKRSQPEVAMPKVDVPKVDNQGLGRSGDSIRLVV